jgi:hypothetical protein
MLCTPRRKKEGEELEIESGAMVLASDWTRKAKDILERTGADDVSSTGEAKADFSKSDKPMRRAG